MIIFSRADWGGTAFVKTPIRSRASHVVIHHTAGAPVAPTPDAEAAYMRQVERMHMDRGWVAIGYGFVIFPSGRIYEGRGWGSVGAHTLGRNRDSVGIAFHIDGRYEAPTQEAWDSCHALIASGIKGDHIAPDPEVSGHRDWAATECPGDLVYYDLARLNAQQTPEIDTEALRLIWSIQRDLRSLWSILAGRTTP